MLRKKDKKWQASLKSACMADKPNFTPPAQNQVYKIKAESVYSPIEKLFFW